MSTPARCLSCGRRTLVPSFEFSPRVLWRCSNPAGGKGGEPCGYKVEGRSLDVPAPVPVGKPVGRPLKADAQNNGGWDSRRAAILRAAAGEAAPIVRIIEVVCQHQNCTIEELCGHERKVWICRARELIVQLARELTALSFPDIARAMGRPNHSSIVTMHQRAMDRMVSETVRAEVAGLIARVSQATGSPRLAGE